MEIYSIWVKAQNDSLRRVGGLIDEIAQAEGTEKFEPHVTLVSSIYSLEKAEEILLNLKDEKLDDQNKTRDKLLKLINFD